MFFTKALQHLCFVRKIFIFSYISTYGYNRTYNEIKNAVTKIQNIEQKTAISYNCSIFLSRGRRRILHGLGQAHWGKPKAAANRTQSHVGPAVGPGGDQQGDALGDGEGDGKSHHQHHLENCQWTEGALYPAAGGK